MALGFVMLVGLAALAAGLVRMQTSSATFTTASLTGLRAQADTAGDWVHLYSQATDPAGLTAYANRRLSDPLVPAAEGQDEGLTIDLGGYPDFKQDFVLERVFTLETPAVFLDPGITQVTIIATLLADPSGVQPLRKLTITGLDGVGNQVSATLGPGQKRQFNVTVRSKRNFDVGTTYHPCVRLALSIAGSPAGYYVYEIPLALTDAGV
jgi:hypothetical protein